MKPFPHALIPIKSVRKTYILIPIKSVHKSHNLIPIKSVHKCNNLIPIKCEALRGLNFVTTAVQHLPICVCVCVHHIMGWVGIIMFVTYTSPAERQIIYFFGLWRVGVRGVRRSVYGCCQLQRRLCCTAFVNM